MQSWFLYILRRADGSLDADITTDLSAETAQHKSGQNGHGRRHKPPVRLVYWQRHMSKTKARQTLTEFRRWPRHQQENFVRGVHGEATRKLKQPRPR